MKRAIPKKDGSFGNHIMKKIIAGLLLTTTVISGVYLYALKRRSMQMPQIVIEKNQDGYRLLIDGKPFVVRGVCYSPVPIGRNYDYNFWGDLRKPWRVDGKWMKEMGVNTVRVYRPGKNPLDVYRAMNDFYSNYGIRVLMGHYLGFWDWPPPNYSDENFRNKVPSWLFAVS